MAANAGPYHRADVRISRLLADFALKSCLEGYRTMARNALGVDEKGEEITTE
ncbi:hypothetical protein [Brevibacillus invocatus]|uniref:hypothetical protein n=1 Tax=Brevibacillus invocatus TaxID=173959 RepID=UPI001606BB5E|nr:hypothetical protein [Brevibacillus invocatus]